MAPPAPLDPLAARLQDRLERLRGLKGRFTQRLESQSLGSPRAESGRFFLRKPGLMRWEYERPERKLAVSDGKVTWLYLPDDREAHRGRQESLDEGGGAALLLSGKLSIERDFSVRRLPEAEAAALGPPGTAKAGVLELLPKATAEDYEKILLVVDTAALEIRKLIVIDPLGDRMVFDLTDLQEDPDLPDDLFVFEPPPGTEVIEAR